MFCSNCGKELPEGAKFCDICGTAVEAAPAAAEASTPAAPEVSAPVQAAIEPEAPASTGKKPKKKMGVFAKIAIAVASLAAVVGIGIGGAFLFARDKVDQFVHSNFDKPKDYYAYVEKKSYQSLTDSNATEVVKKAAQKINEQNLSFHENVELSFGEKGKELTNLASTLGVDLSWFKSIGLEYDGTILKDKLQVSVAPILNNTTILTAVLQLDVKAGVFYLTVPEITDRYIGMNLGEEFGSLYEETMDDLAIFSGKYEEMLAMLPSEEDLTEFADRYFDVIMGQVDDVKKEKAKLKISDIEQSCTALVIDLDKDQLVKILEAVLKEAKDDKMIKDLMLNSIEAMGLEADEFDPEEAYESFQDEIDGMIEELDDISVEHFTMNTYIDNDGNVIGRRVTVEANDEEVVFFFANVTKGSENGFEFSVQHEDEVMFSVTGNGETKNDKYSGEYELEVEGQNYVNFEIEDYDLAEEKKGNLVGSFIFKLGKDVDLNDLASELFDSSTASAAKLIFSALEPAIRVDVNVKENEHEFAISLLDHKDELIVLSFKGGSKEAGDVEFPSAYLDLDENGDFDEEEMYEFMKSLHLKNIVENLKKANLPDEWVDLVEDEIERFEDMIDNYR